MARIKGPKKVHRYSAEFKVKAAKLSDLSGVQVKDVAEALDIHPFMLSRWRKEARESRLRAPGRVCHSAQVTLKVAAQRSEPRPVGPRGGPAERSAAGHESAGEVVGQFESFAP